MIIYLQEADLGLYDQRQTGEIAQLILLSYRSEALSERERRDNPEPAFSHGSGIEHLFYFDFHLCSLHKASLDSRSGFSICLSWGIPYCFLKFPCLLLFSVSEHPGLSAHRSKVGWHLKRGPGEEFDRSFGRPGLWVWDISHDRVGYDAGFHRWQRNLLITTKKIHHFP